LGSLTAKPWEFRKGTFWTEQPEWRVVRVRVKLRVRVRVRVRVKVSATVLG
jgi:hypothetical protein